MPLKRNRAGTSWRSFLERGERLVRVLAFAQLVGVEAAALEEEKEVARDVADRAQLAAVAIARAQEPRGGVAAAVAELREIHFDARNTLEKRRAGIVAGLKAQHFFLRRRRVVAHDAPPLMSVAIDALLEWFDADAMNHVDEALASLSRRSR